MGKIFNDLAYGRYVNTYAGLPLEEAEKTATQLDTQYRENLANQDQLEVMINNLDVRDQNRPHVQKALATARQRLADTRESGDWEHAGFQVAGAAKEFAMDMNVQGALKDKAAATAYMADLDKRLKADEIDGDTYNKAKALASQTNKEQVSYDPITGKYENIFSAYSPMQYQDIQKGVFEMGEKWKSSTEPIDVTYVDKAGKKTTSRVKYDSNLKGYKIVGSETYLTENELQAGLRQAVLANPKYKSFIQEGLMFDKASKFGAGGDKRDLQMTDIFSSADGNQALLPMSEDKAKELVEELGYDWEQMKSDPSMMEALYDQIYMSKTVDGYANPAASAFSFKEIEEKYLTDHVLLEAIKQRNRMALQKDKYARKAQAASIKFKREHPAPVVVANQGAVQVGTQYNSKEFKKAVGETKSLLEQARRDLEANKKDGTGNASEINKRIKDLEWTYKVQKNTYNGHQKSYFQSPSGQVALNNKYRAFVAAYPQGTSLHMSREEFERHVIEGNNDTSGGEIIPSIHRKIAPKFQPSAEATRNRLLNSYNKEVGNEVDEYIKNRDPKSFGGEVLTSTDTKSYLHKVNKAKTAHVLGNRTNYKTGGGLQLDAFIENAANEYGKDNIVVKVATSTTDNNGEFPDYITITSKGTGKTIYQENIYSKSGNADSRRVTGINMMKENRDPASKDYQLGNYMAASGSYSEWKNDDIDSQTNTVNEHDDSTVDPVYSDMFTAGVGNNGQPMNFKVKKSREAFVNADGTPVGTETVWRLVQYDDNGVQKGSLPNPAFQNSDVFKSQDDMKVALWNMQNPNALDDDIQITGFSQSSSMSVPVPTTQTNPQSNK